MFHAQHTQKQSNHLDLLIHRAPTPPPRPKPLSTAMRIRKHAKISPLLYATSSLGPGAGAFIQTHVCQLNQSRWDVAVFSPPSPLPAPPPPSQTAEPDCSTANGSPAHYFTVPERPPESVIDVKREYSGDDSATASMEEEPPPPAVEEEHFTWCCKTDGKSWQCRREAPKGNSLCEHHFSMIKSYINKSGPPAAAAAKKSEKPAAAVAQSTRHASSRPKKAPQTSSSSNPYEFYYYSGFGPRWGKKRGAETDLNDDCEEEIRRSIMEEEFDYVDEYDDDEDEEECKEDRRKRGRKPVKARSLKSLM